MKCNSCNFEVDATQAGDVLHSNDPKIQWVWTAPTDALDISSGMVVLECKMCPHNWYALDGGYYNAGELLDPSDNPGEWL